MKVLISYSNDSQAHFDRIPTFANHQPAVKEKLKYSNITAKLPLTYKILLSYTPTFEEEILINGDADSDERHE